MGTDHELVRRLRRHMLVLHPDTWASHWRHDDYGLQGKPALVCDECGFAEPLPGGQDGPFLAKAAMGVSVSWEVRVEREDHGWSGEDTTIVHNNPPWYEGHDIIRRLGDRRDREDILFLPTWRLRPGDRTVGDAEVIDVVWTLDVKPIVAPIETAYDHLLEEP